MPFVASSSHSECMTAKEFEAAIERGNVEMASGACTVRYDRRRDAIVLTMQSGAIATIPRALIPIVAKAEPEIAAELEISPMGTTLRFPLLDADFGVHALIRRAFDLSQARRAAGATKSSARASASRAGGGLGKSRLDMRHVTHYDIAK